VSDSATTNLPPATSPPRGYGLAREVAEYLRVSPRTLRNWVRLGKFPAPISPGGGKRGRRLWRWSEVEQALTRLGLEGR
jgi:excisionase family DNA binding protein